MAAEDPHPPACDAGAPVLYLSAGSLPCQTARLALEEKGVAYGLRHVNLSALEQLEPWFLKISASGEVPVLVHGEKKTVTVGGEAIARYVDKAFPGPALAKDPKVVDSFFKLVADVAHDDLVHGFYLKSGHPVAKVVLPQVAEGSLARLKACVENATSDAVKAAAKKEIEAKEAELKKFEDPAAMYDAANARFTALLDALDKALDRPASDAPAFLAGADYSLADVACAALLARAQWAAEPREAAAARPRVAAYWAAVSGRKAFGAADVWTTLAPAAALALIGEAALDGAAAMYAIAAREWSLKVAPPLATAWHAVADPVGGAATTAAGAINDHVVHPVTDSNAFKAAALAVKVAADKSGEFMNDKVLTPVKAGGELAANWATDAAAAAGEAAKHAAEATKHAAEAGMAKASEAAAAAGEAAKHAGEAAKHAAEAGMAKASEAAAAAGEAAKHAAEATKHAAEDAASRAKEAVSPKHEDAAKPEAKAEAKAEVTATTA